MVCFMAVGMFRGNDSASRFGPVLRLMTFREGDCHYAETTKKVQGKEELDDCIRHR